MSGPRVKPTIETAGDLTYGRRRAQVLGKELLRRINEYNRAVEAERHRIDAAAAAARARLDAQWAVTDAMHDDLDARTWIHDHGGSITEALKLTHPDHGGTSADFQKTMWARDVLRGKKKTQRPR